eukprot:1163369-Pyramimonas_sp.AAC.1
MQRPPFSFVTYSDLHVPPSAQPCSHSSSPTVTVHPPLASREAIGVDAVHPSVGPRRGGGRP